MFSQRKTVRQDFGLHGQAAAMPHLATIICIRAEISSFVNYPYSVALYFLRFSIKYTNSNSNSEVELVPPTPTLMCIYFIFGKNKVLFTRAGAVSNLWTAKWAKRWRNLSRKCYISCCISDRTPPQDSFPNYHRNWMDVDVRNKEAGVYKYAGRSRISA